MLVDQNLPRTHLCVHDVCALQMPKRTQQSESQLAAAKRAREAAAAARRVRNAAADAAPVSNPPPASTTGSSNSTVVPSAIAPADDLLPMAAPAAATPEGAAPAEGRAGWKRRASSSPDVRLKLLARKGHCTAHACADAQGCDSGSDCTALRCSALQGTVLRCSALHCTCTAPCSALAVVAVVYAHCTRAHAALWGRLVMWKRW
jgi:hypothetical protein